MFECPVCGRGCRCEVEAQKCCAPPAPLESGYYWVRYNDEWEIAHYNQHLQNWILTGSRFLYNTSEFDEIGERIVGHGS